MTLARLYPPHRAASLPHYACCSGDRLGLGQDRTGLGQGGQGMVRNKTRQRQPGARWPGTSPAHPTWAICRYPSVPSFSSPVLVTIRLRYMVVGNLSQGVVATNRHYVEELRHEGLCCFSHRMDRFCLIAHLSDTVRYCTVLYMTLPHISVVSGTCTVRSSSVCTLPCYL